MPDIKINNTTLSFDTVYYCDSINGNDENDGLTRTTTLKTIQAAIDKAGININVAIILSHKSVFEGALDDAGFINIPPDKQITFIGELIDENSVTMPIIRSTNFNCIQNNSNKEINFINIRIESLGDQSTGNYDSYAMMLYQIPEDSVVNMYNCYLMPRGILFLTGSTINIYNSIIDYNGISFVYGIFSYYNVPSAIITFYNCVVLGIMTCSNSSSSSIGVFYNSIVPSTNLSFHDFTDSSNKRIETSSSTIDDNMEITLDTSYYLNQGTGLNPDGTQANIGVYGGEFAWSLVDYKYFILNNNLYKLFNESSSQWETLSITNPPTEQEYLDYGKNNIDLELNNILSLEGSSSIMCYSNDNSLSGNNIMSVVNRDKIIFSNSISLSDVLNIVSFTINSNISGSSILKIAFSPNDGTEWYVYKNSNFNLIDITSLNLKNNGNTIEEFNSINENFNDSFFIEDNKKIKLCFYYDINNYNDELNVDSISYMLNLMGKYTTGNLANIKYRVDFINNSTCKIEIQEPGTYKINY